MDIFRSPMELALGIVLILASLGVVFAKKPIHSALCFLLTLLTLAALYLELSAQFVAVMQVLVYAGAILVLFMFMMMLFQDAMYEIDKVPAKSYAPLIALSGFSFIVAVGFLIYKLYGFNFTASRHPLSFGSVESLGKALYIDFFFPFEAIILLFLVAVVGSLYTAKKEK